MIRSEDRILTTHTGSLPRPEKLVQLMFAKEEGQEVDPSELSLAVKQSVREVVERQLKAGVDIVNDGEVSKPSYATYIKDRLAGFGGESASLVYQDLSEFPAMAERVFKDPGRSRRKTPGCNSKISVHDKDAVFKDIENLKKPQSDYLTKLKAKTINDFKIKFCIKKNNNKEYKDLCKKYQCDNLNI